MKLRTILWRSCRLRCPACGEGQLFRDWIHMHERCASCGLPFDRGPGYYLGSIYVNYGLTALLVTAGYFAGYFSESMSPNALLWTCAAFCVFFPLWFFRYARGIWLGLDHYFDPPEKKQQTADHADGRG
jgi:uncharacterized protein (DUF983 family)